MFDEHNYNNDRVYVDSDLNHSEINGYYWPSSMSKLPYWKFNTRTFCFYYIIQRLIAQILSWKITIFFNLKSNPIMLIRYILHLLILSFHLFRRKIKMKIAISCKRSSLNSHFNFNFNITSAKKMFLKSYRNLILQKFPKI